MNFTGKLVGKIPHIVTLTITCQPPHGSPGNTALVSVMANKSMMLKSTGRSSIGFVGTYHAGLDALSKVIISGLMLMG